MGQQQPALIEFDRRSAIADLHELPRKFRFQNGLTAVPCGEVVRIDQIQILIILPRDHGVIAADLPWEQRHALVLGSSAPQRCQPERHEIVGRDQFGTDRPPAIGGIGRVVGFPALIAKFDKARILNAVRLGFGDRKDDALAQLFFGIESQLDKVAVGSRYAPVDPGARGEPRRRIDAQAAVRCDGTGAKCQ